MHVLLLALPADALFREELRREAEKAEKPTPNKIRERQAEFERRNAAARAKEAAS